MTLMQGHQFRMGPIRAIAAVWVGAAATFLVTAYPTGLAASPAAGLAIRALAAGLVAALAARSADLRPSVAAALSSSATLLGIVAVLSVPGIRWTYPEVALSLTIAALTPVIVCLIRHDKARFALVTLLVIAVVGIQWGVLPIGPVAPGLRSNLALESRQHNPSATPYDDANHYLHVFELMRGGESYYRAFVESWYQGPTAGKRITTPFQVREPALFAFWDVLPGPDDARVVLVAFMVFAAVTAVFCWMTASLFVDSGVALLAVFAWASYAGALFVPNQLFAFSEPWAGALAVWFAYFLLTKRPWPAALLVICAVAVRELMVIFLSAFAVVLWFDRGRRGAPLAYISSALGSFVVLLAHLRLAPVSAAASAVPDFSLWLQSKGIPTLLAALTFAGTWWIGGSRLLPLICLMGVLSLVAVRPFRERVLLATLVLVPLVFLTIIASDGSVYWGALIQPLLIALAPVSLALLAPNFSTSTSMASD